MGKPVTERQLRAVTKMYNTALRTVDGDSNDAEIEAWRNVADEACELLGIDTNALYEKQYARSQR